MIAILGWGSLIWKPKQLPYDGFWRQGGPILPLEFSKVTPTRPLNIVLDPINGVHCQARFAMSLRTTLAEAIADLKQRESCDDEFIGYLDQENDRSSLQEYPQQIDVEDEVRQWCASQGISAAIWTAVPPNFEQCVGVEFSVSAAIEYLKELSQSGLNSALEYIRNTPAEIMTPVRKRVTEIWGS
jgi:hypothetical protein